MSNIGFNLNLFKIVVSVVPVFKGLKHHPKQTICNLAVFLHFEECGDLGVKASFEKKIYLKKTDVEQKVLQISNIGPKILKS